MLLSDQADRDSATGRYGDGRAEGSFELELDLSDLGEANILQAIVRRCEQLDHVTITSAWTCTKMRPDGFGGGITVVTAERILSSSTIQMEGELLDRAEYGDLDKDGDAYAAAA